MPSWKITRQPFPVVSEHSDHFLRRNYRNGVSPDSGYVLIFLLIVAQDAVQSSRNIPILHI